MTVEASIDGDGASGIEAASIRLNADDTSRITANTTSASVAATFAPVGVAIAIAASNAINTIGNTVRAAITNADTVVRARSGVVDVLADEGATIDAKAVASSTALSSLGSASGGGAGAVNTISSKIEATIAGEGKPLLFAVLPADAEAQRVRMTRLREAILEGRDELRVAVRSDRDEDRQARSGHLGA